MTPATVNASMRGMTRPPLTRGTSTPTVSPVSSLKLEASTRPSRMRRAPGTRFSSAARSTMRAKSEAAPSSAGKMPRTTAGCRFAPAASIPSSRTYGVTAVTPGAPAKRLSSSRQSGTPSGADTVACALSTSRRVRVSASRPFSTERITMSAVTPSARPSNEAAVLKDTSARQRRERK